MTEEQQLAAFKALDEEFAAAGGKSLLGSMKSMLSKPKAA